MTSRFVKTVIAAVAVLTMVTGAMGTASASHYELRDIDLVDQATCDKLGKDGIQSTEVLLSRVAKKADRKVLAQRAGVDLTVLDVLARQVDMLRVRGIGPKMVRVFAAVGVDTIAELRQQAPEDLYVRVVRMNDEKHLSEIVPDAGVLAGWIEQARAMPILVED